jgi:Secretion system C-terminal sorting domain
MGSIMKKIIHLVLVGVFFFIIMTSTFCQTNSFIISENNNSINNQNDLPLDSAVLKWDYGWVSSLAFGDTVSAIVAVRFPDTLTSMYSGYYLYKIQIAIRDLPSLAVLKVFTEDTDTTAGTLIYSQDVTNLITPYSLNNFEINPPILITGDDIWIGYEVAMSDTDIVIGIDNGPLNPDGDWIYSPFQNGVWYHLSLFGWHSNWVIRGFLSNTVSVEDIKLNPTSFSLEQNYPNPFNPSTTIRYQIHQTSFVSLKIFDVLGKEEAILVNEEKSPGNYEFIFNANNLSSGVYFFQLKVGNFISTRKMVLLK